MEAQRIRETALETVEQSIQEEIAVEDRMEFIISSSTIQPKVSANIRAPQQSEAEKEMWERYALGHEVFNAGPDSTHALLEERMRLEREAADFDLWHGADFISEDPNDAVLMLDALEQDEIMSELLQNAGNHISHYAV